MNSKSYPSNFPVPVKAKLSLEQPTFSFSIERLKSKSFSSPFIGFKDILRSENLESARAEIWVSLKALKTSWSLALKAYLSKSPLSLSLAGASLGASTFSGSAARVSDNTPIKSATTNLIKFLNIFEFTDNGLTNL